MKNKVLGRQTSTKKTSIARSIDYSPGYEIGVTVLGVVGNAAGEGLTLPGASKTRNKQRLKAMICFLSSKTEEVFATSSLSKEIVYTSSNSVTAPAKIENSTNKAFADLKSIRRFNATWDDGTGHRGSFLSFKTGLAQKISFKLCLAMADSGDVSESMLAYPIGISSMEIDLTSQHGIKIVDVSLNHMEKDKTIKLIEVGIDEQKNNQTKARKWISKRIPSMFTLTKRKTSLKKQGRYEDSSLDEDSFHLNNLAIEDIVVRLRIQIEKKEASVEVSLQDTVDLDRTLTLESSITDTLLCLPEKKDANGKSMNASLSASKPPSGKNTYDTISRSIKDEKTEILDFHQENDEKSREKETFKIGTRAPGLAYTPRKPQSIFCGTLVNAFSVDYDEETIGDTADMSSGILASPSSVSVWSPALHTDRADNRGFSNVSGPLLEFSKSFLACLPSYSDILRAAQKTAYAGNESEIRPVPSLVEADTFFSRGNQSLSMDPTLTMDSGIFSEGVEPTLGIKKNGSMPIEYGSHASARLPIDTTSNVKKSEAKLPRPKGDGIQMTSLNEDIVGKDDRSVIRIASTQFSSDSQKVVCSTNAQEAQAKTSNRKIPIVGAYDYTPIDVPALESEYEPRIWRSTSSAASPLTKAQKRESKSNLRRLHSDPLNDSEAFVGLYYSEPQALDAAFDETHFWKSVVH